jgi:hypothetical protein
MKRKLPFTTRRKHKIQKPDECYLTSIAPELVYQILYFVRHNTALFSVCRLFRNLMYRIWENELPSWDFESSPELPILNFGVEHLAIINKIERRNIQKIFETLRKYSDTYSLVTSKRNELSIYCLDQSQLIHAKCKIPLSCSNLRPDPEHLYFTHQEPFSFSRLIQHGGCIQLEGGLFTNIFAEKLDEPNPGKVFKIRERYRLNEEQTEKVISTRFDSSSYPLLEIGRTTGKIRFGYTSRHGVKTEEDDGYLDILVVTRYLNTFIHLFKQMRCLRMDICFRNNGEKDVGVVLKGYCRDGITITFTTVVLTPVPVFNSLFQETGFTCVQEVLYESENKK